MYAGNKNIYLEGHNMKDYWHTYITDSDFKSSDLYASIFVTLIDEGKLEVDHIPDEGFGVYKWRIKSSCTKVVVNSEPGKLIKILMEDEDKSKIESAA